VQSRTVWHDVVEFRRFTLRNMRWLVTPLVIVTSQESSQGITRQCRRPTLVCYDRVASRDDTVATLVMPLFQSSQPLVSRKTTIRGTKQSIDTEDLSIRGTMRSLQVETLRQIRSLRRSSSRCGSQSCAIPAERHWTSVCGHFSIQAEPAGVVQETQSSNHGARIELATAFPVAL
jgi:hypothetical protein